MEQISQTNSMTVLQNSAVKIENVAVPRPMLKQTSPIVISRMESPRASDVAQKGSQNHIPVADSSIISLPFRWLNLREVQD